MPVLLLLFLCLIQGTGRSQALLTGTGQESCYDLKKKISCGSKDFPKQDGDFYTPAAGHARFIKLFSGVINDKETKLSWMECSFHTLLKDAKCTKASKLNWDAAAKSCAQLKMGGQRWRLPTVMELNSLLNLHVSGIKIFQHYFPNTRAGPYWTASYSLTASEANYNDHAWYVNFANGSIFDAKLISEHYVRCVSGD